MKIYVNGKEINLPQNAFVAKGGEGSVFKLGNTCFKIYEDLGKMIHPGKIKELGSLEHPNILGPKEVILNNKKQTIGFTMDWVDGTVALCKLFTTTYQQINNIDNDMIIQLVENIKELTKYAHSKKCLIVDNNELNCLVSEQDFITPYFIDVNSWQTPSFSATAIMPSIRDWTTDTFTEETDWFSFGILAFQLFIGIHPFKGKHKSYKKNDFVNRVRDRVSVFNGGVSLPAATRDFNLIPTAYKEWFYRIFENGDRIPPPLTPGDKTQIAVKVEVVNSTGTFDMKIIFEMDDNILYHNPETNITKTKNRIFIGKQEYKVSNDVEILRTPLEQEPVFVKIKDNMLRMKPVNEFRQIKELELKATDMMIVDDHLYTKNNERLVELDFRVINKTVIPSIKTIWKIEPLSSMLLSNVIYQSVLGKAHLCIPKPNKSGKSKFYTKAIPEIDDYKIIEGKYQNKVCMLIGHYQTKYHKIIIIFNDDHSDYKLRIENDIDYVPLNFVVLDNGVCVSITEDNAVELFHNRLDKPDLKRIEDPGIDATMRLCKDFTKVKFFKENKVYSMTMKGN